MAEWDGLTTYAVGDVVEHLNVSYQALNANLGSEPPSADWTIVPWDDEFVGGVADDTTPPDPPAWVTVLASQTRIQVMWDAPTEGDSASYDSSPDWDGDIGTAYIGEDWDEIAIENGAQSPIGYHFDGFVPGNPADTATGLPPIEDQEYFTDSRSVPYPTIHPDLTFVPITPTQTQEVLGFDVEPNEEIAYYQVQVALDAAFQDIIRHDRMVKAHVRTWRYSRPSSRTFHARVRAVDLFGNKSEWVSSDDYNKFPCQPYPPNVVMKKRPNGNYQAKVNYLNDITLSPELDETVSRFQFAMRELEFTRLSTGVVASDTVLLVTDFASDEVPMNPGTDAPDFVVFVGNEQMLVTSISGANSLQWHVTRGYNGTTAATHLAGKAVDYFGKGTSANSQMVTLDDQNARTWVAWGGLDPGSRWKFKVRVIDAQNRKSFWSDWTPVMTTTIGAKYSNGDPPGCAGAGGDPDVDPTPPVVDPPAPVVDPGTTDPVETSTWPHERIIRFEMGVSTGSTSAAATGYNAVATAARVTVSSAPALLDATVDINLNGVSFLTVTIPAADPKNQSDLTWVTPPPRIGSQTGQLVVDTDEITVTETNMQDASGLLTVYLMVYLT